MTDPTDPPYRENADAQRVGFELVSGGKARIVRFDLVRQTQDGRPTAVYFVTIDRTDHVLEEPRSFVVPIKQVSRWLAFVDAACLHRAPSGVFEWPRARYGSGDDGLRMLAPDTGRVECRGGGDLEEPDERSMIDVSCMPADADRITLSQGGVLGASEAIQLGRLLVWMGQRVHMRQRWRDAGRDTGPDFVREMDRQRNGLSATEQVRSMLEAVEHKQAIVSEIRGTARSDRFEVMVDFPGGQGCVLACDRTGTRSFVKVNHNPLISNSPGAVSHAPGCYAMAKGCTAGPADTPALAREWLDQFLTRERIVTSDQRYGVQSCEVPT